MKLIRKILLCGLLLAVIAGQCMAQQRTRILFLLDASLSMNNQWKGGSKWIIATNALIDIADSVSHIPNTEVGLRVFGHLFGEPEENCHDSRLEVPIDSNALKRIKLKLSQIRPKGITPLVYSIEKSAADFGGIQAKNILVIITDGEETCGGDPCKVATALQRNGIILRPFVIGMALQPNAFDEMNCIGKFTNTRSAEEFSAIIKNVVLEAVASTSLQVNLNDEQGKPTETNVNMTFYDKETGLVKYNMYHSLNTRGLPDTLLISQMFKYKLQVHTIPPLVVDDLELKPNHHNIINVKAAQGFIHLTVQGSGSKTLARELVKCLIHKAGESQTLHVQNINSTEKYLTGTYNLEVMTLPRMSIGNVKVEQSKTTEVQIRAPGLFTVNKNFEVYGAIFTMEENKMKKIYELPANDKQENIRLQPGKYRLVYRAKNAHSIHSTVDKEFEITSGGSVSLKL